MKQKTMIVGITGGIASGKSTVLAALRRCGAATIDVDRIARDVVLPGTSALKRIARVFGKAVLTPQGSLNRRKLAAVIFSDPLLRQKLEKITHPAIIARLSLQIRRHRDQPSAPLVAAEVPLLYEARLQKLFDAVVVVWATGAVQRQRLIARQKLSRAEAARRIQAQYPLSRKKAMADYVINNNGSRSTAARQARDLFHRLTKTEK